jgi:TonB family protein
MREENWYKMFFIALLLHVFIIGAFSIPFKKTTKAIDLSSYSVNLVGDITPAAGMTEPAREATKPAPPPAQKPAEPKKTKLAEKEKVVIGRKERSLTPVKKKEVPETLTKDEARSLDQRIRQMRSHIQYLDVAAKSPGKGQGSTGFPGSSMGGSSIDPALQRYYADVWEAIQNAWHSPNLSATKNLVTVVSIRIRKDGKISDWTIEKGSGNRVYDESVSRALRSIDALPPIPPSFNADYLEIGFNFHPPGETK